MAKVYKQKIPSPLSGKGLANNVSVANKAESTRLRDDDYAVKATPL